MVQPPSPRWLLRAAAALVLVGLLVPSAISAATYEPTSLRPGTIEKPANGTTVISVQGYKFRGKGNPKKPPRLVGVGPRGGLRWSKNGAERDIGWFYDVDPLPGGTLLVVATKSNATTTVYRYDPATGERVWTERLATKDTHDVDLLGDDRLLVADMRNVNESADRNDARLFVYNRTTDEAVWAFYFRAHYPPSAGGPYGERTPYAWIHLNDVDRVTGGTYLASLRNFDQVVLINRSRKEITGRLGADGTHDVLYEQHNPQFLRGEGGRPTVLVADSENDRVVEYALVNGSWERTWALEGFTWPRDADRLPNGNTLVVDTLNHRVVEVTPTGEVVWEFYAPWAPYDAERVRHGDEPGGPTIREQNATGAYVVTGSANLTRGERPAFAKRLAGAFAGTPVGEEVEWAATRWSHIAPWVRPVWLDPRAFVAAVGAGLFVTAWGVAELVYHRRRLRGALATAAARVRDGFSRI